MSRLYADNWTAKAALHYHSEMNPTPNLAIPAELLSELEQKYFWWEPVGDKPRSPARILAHAMDLATFADIRRIEALIAPTQLAEFMLHIEPGWLSPQSWGLWRGRLSLATGIAIPDEPPQRSFKS